MRFEAEPPWRWFAHCHCSICRRHHGSLFSTSVGTDASRFRWIAGGEHVRRYRASPAFERPFCGRCGSKLPAPPQDPRLVNVPAGMLDGDLGGATPRTRIFVASKAACDGIADALPRHDAYPPGACPPGAHPPGADPYDIHPTGADPYDARPSGADPHDADPHDADPSGARAAEASDERRARPEPATALTGGCACGAIAFRIAGGIGKLLHNHAAAARRSRGAAYASDAAVAAERLHWLRGLDSLETISLDAPGAPTPAGPFTAAFCRVCGALQPSPLVDGAADADGGGGAQPGAGREPAAFLVPCGAIDSAPAPAAGAVHIHVASKAEWFGIADSLPRFAALPPGGVRAG
ncbi:MAG: GFA family protein [Gammaproteobacteria bacterium]|nr:GFA family protein [Gammaproteobacteria bacterium]